MVPFKILANYEPSRHKFKVSFSFIDEDDIPISYIEVMDKDRWHEFVDSIDDIIEIAGYQITLIAYPETREAVSNYIKQVHRAYVFNGNTDMI